MSTVLPLASSRVVALVVALAVASADLGHAPTGARVLGLELEEGPSRPRPQQIDRVREQRQRMLARTPDEPRGRATAVDRLLAGYTGYLVADAARISASWTLARARRGTGMIAT